MIVLNPTDSRPLYEQITEKLKELIIGGFLREEDKFPSVRELAQSLAINPNTIQKAYKQLEGEGYIIARPAKGYFVKSVEKANPERIEQLKGQLSDICDELHYLGVHKQEITRIIDSCYQKK